MGYPRNDYTPFCVNRGKLLKEFAPVGAVSFHLLKISFWKGFVLQESIQEIIRALDKREYLVIVRDIFVSST